MSDDRRDSRLDPELIRAAPALARIGAAAWWRTTQWTMGVSLRTGVRVVRAARTGESPAQFLEETSADVRSYVRALLGDGTPDGMEAEADSNGRPEGLPASPAELRKRGAELLDRSAEVGVDDEIHPAYARILDELAPDEGRILRLLATEGPQPSVDVRTGTLPVSVNSQLVAPGLTMIGAEAGCRHLKRVHAYLDNLNRLGLIWFSREALDDLARYQVLEAQPEVLDALRRAGRGRTVRRSIQLTPFGEDFCEMCLPLGTAELDALPGGAVPEADPADGEVTA